MSPSREDSVPRRIARELRAAAQKMRAQADELDRAADEYESRLHFDRKRKEPDVRPSA